MKNIEVVRYKDRLDKLFKKVGNLGSDLELQSHWSRYLCVLVLGFIETAVAAIYSEYARRKASPKVAHYVAKKLDRFQNPNMRKIINLSASFDLDWAKSLADQTNGELKDAIDSIYANRNSIAHGKDSGVSYTNISRWYQNAVKVIELIEKQCEN